MGQSNPISGLSLVDGDWCGGGDSHLHLLIELSLVPCQNPATERYLETTDPIIHHSSSWHPATWTESWEWWEVKFLQSWAKFQQYDGIWKHNSLLHSRYLHAFKKFSISDNDKPEYVHVNTTIWKISTYIFQQNSLCLKPHSHSQPTILKTVTMVPCANCTTLCVCVWGGGCARRLYWYEQDGENLLLPCCISPFTSYLALG